MATTPASSPCSRAMSTAVRAASSTTTPSTSCEVGQQHARLMPLDAVPDASARRPEPRQVDQRQLLLQRRDPQVRRRRVVADRVVPSHAQPRDPRLQLRPPDVLVQPVPQLAGDVVPAPDHDPLAGADGSLRCRPAVSPSGKRLLAGDDAVVARHGGQHGRVTVRLSHRPTVLRPASVSPGLRGSLWRRRTDASLWTASGPANGPRSPVALSNAPLNPLLTRSSGSVVGLRGGYSQQLSRPSGRWSGGSRRPRGRGRPCRPRRPCPRRGGRRPSCCRPRRRP